MNNLTIDLKKRIDSTTIDTSILAETPLLIDYQYTYIGGKDDIVIDISSLSTDLQDAWKKIIDHHTFQYEENALIFKIEYFSKTFSLAKSYVRDSESTDGTLTAILAGTPLILRIEVPTFTSVNFIEIPLWYDQDFDPSDLSAAAAIGVSISGNGESFTIDNDRECRLFFIKPTTEILQYIIDFPLINQIVPV